MNRFESAITSQQDTVELLESGPKPNEAIENLIAIIRATDLIGMTGVDPLPTSETHSYTDSLYTHSVRDDVGTRPPKAFLLQAIPDDFTTLPREVAIRHPGILYVISGTSESSLETNSIPASHTDTWLPLVMLGHASHPLTRAIVGTFAFNKISLNEQFGTPILIDADDPESPFVDAQQFASSSAYALSRVPYLDETGKTKEWIDASTANWKDYLNGNVFEQPPLPEGSIVHESARADEVTGHLLPIMVGAQTIFAVARERGISPMNRFRAVAGILNHHAVLGFIDVAVKEYLRPPASDSP